VLITIKVEVIAREQHGGRCCGCGGGCGKRGTERLLVSRKQALKPHCFRAQKGCQSEQVLALTGLSIPGCVASGGRARQQLADVSLAASAQSVHLVQAQPQLQLRSALQAERVLARE
jgi:hypothetical protein